MAMIDGVNDPVLSSSPARTFERFFCALSFAALLTLSAVKHSSQSLGLFSLIMRVSIVPCLYESQRRQHLNVSLCLKPIVAMLRLAHLVRLF